MYHRGFTLASMSRSTAASCAGVSGVMWPRARERRRGNGTPAGVQVHDEVVIGDHDVVRVVARATHSAIGLPACRRRSGC